MSTFVIVWMWAVGLPPAYYGLLQGGRLRHSRAKIVMAFLWPLTLPILATFGYLSARYERNRGI